MIKCTLVLAFLTSSFYSDAQINFDAYNKITNSDFANFISLFSQEEVPISTNKLFAEQNLLETAREAISDEIIDRFLKREGTHLISKLYDRVTEDGIDYPIMGTLYPLFKLPTNGDYVMLVISQIDDFESFNKVHVMTFDLSGQFIYFAHTLYNSNSIDINNSIDGNLRATYNYVLYEVDGQDGDPPSDQEFSGLEAKSVYQINSDGRKTKVSFTKTPGQFIWNDEELRFKKVD